MDTSFELPTVGNESIHVRLFQPALASHTDLLKAIAKQLTLDVCSHEILIPAECFDSYATRMFYTPEEFTSVGVGAAILSE